MFLQLVSHSCGSQEQSCATVPALTGSRAWEAPLGEGWPSAVRAWWDFWVQSTLFHPGRRLLPSPGELCVHLGLFPCA